MNLSMDSLAKTIHILGSVKVKDSAGELKEVFANDPLIEDLLQQASEFFNNNRSYDRKSFEKLMEFALRGYFDRVSIVGSTLICANCGEHALSSSLLDSRGESIQIDCEQCKSNLAHFATDAELSFFRGELMRREKLP